MLLKHQKNHKIPTRKNPLKPIYQISKKRTNMTCRVRYSVHRAVFSTLHSLTISISLTKINGKLLFLGSVFNTALRVFLLKVVNF